MNGTDLFPVVLSEELEPLVDRAKLLIMASYYRAQNRKLYPTKVPKLANNSLEYLFYNQLHKQQLSSARARRLSASSNMPFGTAGIRLRKAQFPTEFLDAPALFKQVERGRSAIGALNKLKFASPKSLQAQIGNDLYADLKTLAPQFVKRMQTHEKHLTSLSSSKARAKANADLIAQLIQFKPTLLVNESSPTASSGSTALATELRLNLVKVKCLDPVDWELFTDWVENSISMGGIAFDSTNQKIEVGEFHVAQFDQGEVFDFNGTPRRFASFDLTQAGTWPRYFYATLAMAEKDAHGGFLSTLQQLWDAVDDAVIQSLTSAIVAGLASAGVVGGGVVGGPVGALVGDIVGIAVGFAVDLIFTELQDDIFEMAYITPMALLSAQQFEDSGTRTSNTYQVEISSGNEGGNGRYRVDFNWTLHPQ